MYEEDEEVDEEERTDKVLAWRSGLVVVVV